MMRDGRETGGTPYSAGALTHVLRNVLYTGRIGHRGADYPGEHTATICAARGTRRKRRSTAARRARVPAARRCSPAGTLH